MDAEKDCKDYSEEKNEVHFGNNLEYKEHLQKREEEEEAEQEVVTTEAQVAKSDKENNFKINVDTEVYKAEDIDIYTERCKNNNNHSPPTSTTEEITFSTDAPAAVDLESLEENHKNEGINLSKDSNLSELKDEAELTEQTSQKNMIETIGTDILRSKSPKVNGNHTPSQINECDQSEMVVPPDESSSMIELPKNFCEDNSPRMASSLKLEENEYNVDSQNTDIEYKLLQLDFVNHSSNSAILTEAEPKENNAKIENVNCQNEIEENSRDSTSNSVHSLSSIKSSSSQQLVIDQPIEEAKLSMPPRPNAKRKINKRIKRDTMKKAAMDSRRKKSELSKDKVSAQSDLPTSQLVPIPDSSSGVSTTVKCLVGEAVLPEDVQQPTHIAHPYCQCKIDGVEDTLHQQNCEFYKPLAMYYYKCSSCQTYHEKWSLFLHIHEYHDRFLCLYCIKCFPTAEKLSLHLEIKHDLEQNHFNSEEAFRSSAVLYNGYSLETRFLMCCTCQHIFRESAAFTEHICMEYMKSCNLCGQKGRHTNQCKAHPFAKRRNKKKVKEKSKNSIEASITNDSPPDATKEPVLESIAHNEDSNSSSNMVIDESCNTNHNMIADINPFKALDECERLEKQQIEHSPAVATPASFFALSDNRMEIENANENSNILKFKLRVPKEFQKAVDELISSSESEDGSCELESGNQAVQVTEVNLENETSEPQGLELPSNEKDNSKENSACDVSYNIEEDESMDDEEPNLHLARILQEIEQTKLDIQRTKETMHSSQKTGTTTHTRENAEKNWTPTPPASPNTSAAPEVTTNSDHIQENAELDHLAEQQQDSDVMPNESVAEPSVENENVEVAIEDQQDDESSTKVPDATVNSPKTSTSPMASNPVPSDGIEVANEDFLVVELQLDRPLSKYEIVEFVRVCLKSAYPFCLYCNHARRIAVNAESLVLHLLSQHRFSATVDSITAEELQPDTIVSKLKSFLPELQNEYMNSNSYCTMGNGAFTRHFNERIFECFQCRFVTSTHKELYLHNRKMHLRTAILCFMCRCNFYSFSEILCHICPGVPHKVSIFEIKFRCCLCNIDNIPSPFRLMVHLRKRHFACDICLEDCRDQSKLSSHVWKHKLHHLCYRCGIAYRNKMDITKHLFWKHGTESAICKRCLNKRWPHVYHFCVPPTTFVCEICQLCFSKAVYLTVHKRMHMQDFRYPCTEENCEAKFISRKLLLKHAQQHETDHTLESKFLNEGNEVETPEQLQGKRSESETKQDCEEDVKVNIPKLEEGDELDALQSERESVTETPKGIPMDVEESIEEKPQKKKKKKRNKESLEDLNLTAPNLSESGSSSESESESKSTKCEEDVPQVMLSPPSESGDVREQKLSETDDTENPIKVLEIWKNFLQAQQSNVEETVETPKYVDYTEDDYPTPKQLHVCYSDHDYCNMFRPPTPPQPPPPPPDTNEPLKSSFSQSPHRPSSRNSNNSSSSSNGSSDESSSSNCTCGTKCSCTADSSSSSSSSSSENSDSSSASRKQQRKKTVRRHRKSESASPLKNRTISEIVNVLDGDEYNQEAKKQLEKSVSTPEPTINESDLETAESESDEDYYDEHPQKLANELLSKKRAQLMARTLLSPSHNYDIVENSRPSTPSLPEDVVCEKRKKKRKRDRKYSGRKYPEQTQEEERVEISNSYSAIPQQVTITQQTHVLQNEAEHTGFAYGATPFETVDQIYTGATAIPSFPAQQSLVVQHTRISEGSSCSDVDGSLKRSKRTRRPNKFYGYTSDDESTGTSNFGQPLVIGMRAFKPQPPPQLVWNKEDLPTPSKSILNNKKTPRVSKRHDDFSTPNSNFEGDHKLHGSLPKKKRIGSSSLPNSNRKRIAKSLGNRPHLPPIPRLKIRPSLFGLSKTMNSFSGEQLQNSLNSSSQHKNSTLDEADDSSDATSEEDQPSELKTWRKTPVSSDLHAESEAIQSPISTPVSLLAYQQPLPPPVLPRVLPPTPQTTVFNHKIPPALLPNPDFATLQYFKANNIRYPIRPPAGARAARDGESVYCYCRCPYDEVSEMIACDGDNCLIEWFHFECVGIMVAPQGKWFCAECRPHYSEDLYPAIAAPGIIANIRDH